MKKLLLLLSALLVVPAWAGEAASSAAGGVVIELKGPAAQLATLQAALEKDAAYREAACSSAKKPGTTASISCAKGDKGLKALLAKHAPASVQWSIAAATTAPTVTPLGVAPALACATGCTAMACPPPSGPVVCCKRTPTGYKPC